MKENQKLNLKRVAQALKGAGGGPQINSPDNKWEMVSNYLAHQAKCQSLLQVLAIELRKHGRKAQAEGINYAHSGELNYVEELLEQIETFLTGSEE